MLHGRRLLVFFLIVSRCFISDNRFASETHAPRVTRRPLTTPPAGHRSRRSDRRRSERIKAVGKRGDVTVPRGARGSTSRKDRSPRVDRRPLPLPTSSARFSSPWHHRLPRHHAERRRMDDGAAHGTQLGKIRGPRICPPAPGSSVLPRLGAAR